MKLLIFYANCYTAGVSRASYTAAFSKILTGEGRTFYFNKIVGKKNSFEYTVNLMKLEFETEHRQERITIGWENVKLEDFNKIDPEKKIVEVFEIMRKYLINDQSILRPEMNSDEIIRDKL